MMCNVLLSKRLRSKTRTIMPSHFPHQEGEGVFLPGRATSCWEVDLMPQSAIIRRLLFLAIPTMTIPSQHQLPAEDYLRISRVIASALDAIDANTAKACLFFAVAGAWIVERIYRRRAIPVAGAAFYRVDDETGFTIAYGTLNNGIPDSHEGAFHCWVETEHAVIDFMAPLFQDEVLAGGRKERVPSRMFQKARSEMADSPFSMKREGDFYLAPNLVLGQRLIANWLTHPINSDVVEICIDWFRQPPAPLPESVTMGSSRGSSREIRLRSIELAGTW